MARLMSVALTERQVRERIKTETRRANWWSTKSGRKIIQVGDTLTLCRKVMGRKAGEPLIRIANVRVTDVRREPLNTITVEGVAAEGFPEWTPAEFIAFFTRHMGGAPDQTVTVICWEYL
jgi:hypothetical protein